MRKFVYKPWGWYITLEEQKDFKVKRITLHPHQRFSLQYHEYREEHWTIVEGIGYITQYGQEGVIRPGEYAYIPKKGVHRLKGGKDGITFIEVQRGDCREDDIVRLEDDYGRT